MVSKFERFWIIFILRFAFGFLFLIAAINIFTYGVDNFATELSQGFADTWVAKIEIGEAEGGEAAFTGMAFVEFFLYAAPWIMAVLCVPILTGILARPALRLGAILMICFGLGKYVQQDIATTAADFLFAFIICAGLYFMSLEKTRRTPEEVEA